MPFLFIVIEIFFLAIKLLIGKFCKMPLFERGSHLQSLKPPVSDCPVSGTASPRQEPLWKLLFHSQRDVYHLLQAGQWLHQPLKACDTRVPVCPLCPAFPPSRVWQHDLVLAWLKTGKTSALLWPEHPWHPSPFTQLQLLPCNCLPCRAHATNPFHSENPLTAPKEQLLKR